MKHFFLFIFLLVSQLVFGQDEIQSGKLMQHVSYLSSDKLEGRLPGTKGNKLAVQYIRKHFKQSGVQPLLPRYEQSFPLTVRLITDFGADNYVQIGNSAPLRLNKDYGVYPFSASRVYMGAPIIMTKDNAVAFGIITQYPKHWLLLWKQKTGVPSTDSLSDYALATKAMEKGVAGVIFVCPDSVDKKDVLVRLRPRPDKQLSIPVIQLKRSVWENMQPQLFPNNPESTLISYSSSETLAAGIYFMPLQITANNIVGLIEGSDPVLKNEYIVLGAHYDHLGYGGYGTGSLQPDTVAIHNGADDNASGTAALLEISRQLAANSKQLKRSVIIVAFSGEEEGLMGSKYFVEHLPVPKQSIKIMLNMDMLGSVNNQNNLYMGGAGTFPDGVQFMKDLGKDSDLKLVVNAGGVGGSDHVSFYKQQIPCIGFHTGGTAMYHTPGDDAALINAKGLESVARYIYSTVVGLSVREGKWEFIAQD